MVKHLNSVCERIQIVENVLRFRVQRQNIRIQHTIQVRY